MKMTLLCVMSMALCIFAKSVSANVFINEVAWMGTVPKEGESAQAAANNEWIELYNTETSVVSLEGWKIMGEDSMPNFALSGTISANGYFLLERGSDDVVSTIPADIVYPYKNNALSNSGEHLLLKNQTGEIVDELNFGSGWPAGDNTTKDTMQRSGNNWLTGHPTPRAVNSVSVISSNQSSVVSSISPSPSSTDSSSNYSPPSPVAKSYEPLLTAYGGENKKVAAGSLVDFLGYAVNKKHEQVENVRFLWNFGDGETKEGRSITHIYQIPGKYTVGLHVTAGDTVASDYMIVEVVSNQTSIGDVLEGEKGFIRLTNPSDAEIDIGGWMIDDGVGVRFSLPPETKIGTHSEIALSNKITKLLLGSTTYPVTLRLPNTSILLQKFPPLKQSSSTNFVAVVEKVMMQKKEIASLVVPDTIKEKNINTRVLSDEPTKNVDIKLTATTSKKDALISVAQGSAKRTAIFFAIAFVISSAAACSFLFFKKFL